MTGRHIILDGSFVDEFGHALAYNSLLKASLDASNIDNYIIASRHMDSKLQDALSAVASLQSNYINLPKIHNDYTFVEYWLANNKLIEDDLAGLAWLNISENDTLIFHSTWSSQALGIYRWYNRLPEKRPRICLKFHLPFTVAGAEDAALSRALFVKSLSGWSKCRGRVVIGSTNDGLTQHINKLTGINVVTLPPIVRTNGAKSPKVSNPRPLIGVLNASVGGKGLDIIRALIRNHEVVKLADWLIQGADGPADDTTRVAGSTINFLPDRIPRQEFLELFHKCDVFILPFHPGAFFLRVSTVFVELLAAGRPVVVSPGGWMAVQLQRFGMPGVVASMYSPDAFAAALKQTLANLDEYEGRAARASRSVSESFSAERFLHAMEDGFAQLKESL